MPGLTAEQMERRRLRLTGSTIAEYLGKSPWRSPNQAWRIAMGLEEPVETEEMAAGNFMEAGIGDLALHQLGIDPGEASKPDTMYHPDHAEAICVHPDLLVPVESIGIQIKNHNPHVAKATYKGQPGDGGPDDNALVPLHILLQCQLEMEVCDAVWAQRAARGHYDRWILAAYFGGADLKLYWIRRHPKLVRGMLSAGLAFWRRHLDPAGPQEEPSDEHWVGPPASRRGKRSKLPSEALDVAPIPFLDTEGAEPFEPKIPFLED